MPKSDRSPREPRVVREVFGHLPDGSAVEMVRLRGDNGFEARIITYGAAVQSHVRPGSRRTACRCGARPGRSCRLCRGSALPWRHRRALCQPHRRAAASSSTATAFNCPPMTAPTRCMAASTASIARTGRITAIGEKPAPFVTLSYVSAGRRGRLSRPAHHQPHLQHFRRHGAFGRVLRGDRQADRRQPDQSQLLQPRRRRGRRRRHSRPPPHHRGGQLSAGERRRHPAGRAEPGRRHAV